MPVSVTKKSRVFKVASETPVVDLVAPDLTEPVPVPVPVPVATEPVPVATEPVATEPVPVATEPVPVATEPVPVATEPVPLDFDTEVAGLEPAVAAEPEMWRGIELEPVKTDMPPLESDKEEESDSEMPPLCTGKCTDCDCSSLKNNKGLTISAMIEKAIEDHLSPEESADDADAENEDEDEDESEAENTRPRTISDTIKETLEEHLNPKEPPSRPDYTLIIVSLTLAIGLWRLYVSVNTSVNGRNEF
jgi:hypothetical protein